MAGLREMEMLKRIRGCYRAEYWLAALLLAGAMAMLTIALLLVISASYPLGRIIILPSALIVAGVVLFLKWRALPSDVVIARRLDRDLASEERIQTLVENKEEQGPIIEALRQETEVFLAGSKPKYRPCKRSFLLPGSLLAGGLAILILALAFTPGLTRSLAARERLRARQEEAAAQVEELIAYLPANPLADELVESLERLKDSAYTLQNDEEFETMEREVAEALAAALEQAEAMALADDELQGIVPLVEELGQELEAPLAAELADAADNLARTLPQNLNLKEALAEIATRPLDIDERMWQEAMEELKDLNPSAYLDALSGALRQAGVPGQEPGDEPGQGTAQGETGAGQGPGEGQGSGQGEGQGSGENPNPGAGQGQGEGEGSGAGSGEAAPSPGSYVYIPGEGIVVLAGEGEPGGYTLRDILPHQPSLLDDYGGYFDSYRRQALSRLGRSQIPLPLTDYVRSYFEAIAPRGGK